MKAHRCDTILTRVVNYIFKGTILMSTVEELKADLELVNANIAASDAKLDEIRDFIAALKADSVITQEQLDALAALVAAAKGGSAEVLAEADALDE